MTSIGEKAFVECPKLTTVTINSNAILSSGNSVKNIFGEQVTTYNLGEAITKIGDNAFYRCSNLTSITIPKKVTSIGYNAFAYCSGLTSITIPEAVTSIGQNAFANCALTTLSLPKNVNYIGDGAFNCSSLTWVKVYNKKPCTIGGSAIGGESGTLCVPAGSKAAYESADCWKNFNTLIECIPVPFANEGIKALCLEHWDSNGDGEFTADEAAFVKNVGTVFKGQPISTELAYFTGLTQIDNEAFSGCTELTSVTISDRVTSIGRRAFQGCEKLAEILVKADSPATLGVSAFSGIAPEAIIFVPRNSLSTYTTASVWRNYKNIMMPPYAQTYRVMYDGKVAKEVSIDRYPRESMPEMPEELNHVYVSLTCESEWPEVVKSDNTIVYQATWSGPFQFSNSEEDAEWRNLTIGDGFYMYADAWDENQIYVRANRGAEVGDLVSDEYQWAIGGNPYQLVIYNKSTGFDRSLTVPAGNTDFWRSASPMIDGIYGWEYTAGDGLSLYESTYRFYYLNLNEMGALVVYGSEPSSSTTIRLQDVPSRNWIDGTEMAATAGQRVIVPIVLNNETNIAGLQFTLTLPEGIMLTRIATTPRTAMFNLMCSPTSEKNTYNVLLFHPGVGRILGNKGDILYMELVVDASVASESWQMQHYDEYIQYSDIVLATPDNADITTVNGHSWLSVQNINLGDANNDTKTNVTDIISTANYIYGNTSTIQNFESADTNSDGRINVADIVGIANLIVSGNIIGITK